ncbi:NADP-dependent oxidoreductase [Croceicoccus sp. BE223]|uniref:NADP-dependent oxidoreductase n=1 Tax=Croceicoccus sp. BE223 TaxID=2817716 RepID=UPI00285C9E46|nr:NADP-dependent oxidoreductase [Croceicoccus sp. BE223]MDR7101910.1 NADPH-dependent curcumin reductase CurA [Croceicoccus sp. BE223]
MTVNRRFLLRRRPVGDPVPDDFELVSEPVPGAPAGGLVVRNHFASLDPAQRGWMSDEPNYMPPIPLGAPVRATTVGEVVASDNPEFPVGTWVIGLNGIEEYSAILPEFFTQKVDVTAVSSPSKFLSAMGAVGLTAYFAMTDIAKPKAGETLCVSGAAGAVGSVVGQIGKIHGCRTIGIAGGLEKCRRLVDDYGYDVAIDYRGKSEEQLREEIARAAPDGINILFENVGGTVMEAEVFNLARKARVILCGLISEYNAVEPHGLKNLWQILVHEATMHGFLIMDYVARFPEGGAQVAQWIAEGKLRIDEHVQEGIENAYPAFMRLFTGANTGKLLLKLA